MNLDDLFSEIGMGGAGTPVTPAAPVAPAPMPPAPPMAPNLGALMGGGGGGKMQQILQMLPLLLSGVSGKAGVGAFMQGWQQADQHLKSQQTQQQELQQNQQRIDLARQAQAQQEQQRIAAEADRKAREAAQLERAFVGELDKTSSKDDYDQLVSQFETLMGAKPNTLRAKYPFVAPSAAKRAAAVWQRVSTGPGKDGIRPGAVVNFDLDGDGVSERVPVEKLAELAGQPLMYDPQDGSPILAPTEAKKPGDRFQEVLTAAREVFKIEKGRAPTPQEDQDLIAKAIKDSSASQVDPEMADIRKQGAQLQNQIAQLTLQGKQAGQNQSTLPPQTQRRVDAKARGFEALPLVKNTQKMSEAVAFSKSLDVNTKNPADDQALIYAFAKAMDPDSVVREGEYATVQKYAQSWAESFGFNAKRVFSNTAFLTPQARANMKATIEKKFLAGKQQYDAARKSYVDQINKITGQGDGESWLTDFGAAFPSSDVAPAAGATGKRFEIISVK